jgi:hypothetical protein
MSNIVDAQFLLDMRQKVLANKEAGLPAKTGISDEEQTKFLALLRPARSAAVTSGEKKPSSRKASTVPMSDADVDSLFKL